MANVTFGMARDVIVRDTHAIRFENFCNAIVGKIEGGVVVHCTSQTWDRGRDGKTTGPVPRVIVCASLNDWPEDKAISDIAKVAKNCTPLPDRVWFCSSQELTEHREDKIAAEIGADLPEEVSVQVLDAKHLSDFAARFPEIIEQHYAAELRDIRRALAQEHEQNEDAARAALHLALCSMGHKDSAAVRDDTYRAALRLTFKDGRARTVAEVCRDATARFKLGHNIPSHILRVHIVHLVDEGQLSEVDGGRYVITDAGRQLTDQAEKIALENLARGRMAIRRQVEEEIGTQLPAEQFNAMWKVLQDKMVSLFYTRGREMVGCIASLVSTVATPEPAYADRQPFFAADLAKSVAATCSSPDQARDVERAIEDIFSEGLGPAFEWLVDVCSAFLSLCSLGLEESSGEQIRQAIANMSLVLDTDVVLSLLCEGEPDHISVDELVRKWREHGGKILIADPVLREAAHHAWIAQQDFDQVSYWLPGTPEERIRYTRNAFVRGFAELLAKGQAKLGHWKKYIDQFRGRSEDDPSRVNAYLRDEYRTGSLPRVSRPDTPEEIAVFRFCEERAQANAKSARDLKISGDKARRDAELYISLDRHSANLEQAEPGASCFLVTSSQRLAEIERRFGPNGADSESRILPIATAVALLSLVPGVSIGITAMRAFLFDGSIPRGTSELEMALRRILRESTTVSIPFARRRALQREVRTRIVRVARDATANQAERDKLVREIEEDFKFGTNTGRAAAILSSALDSVSAERKVERDLAAARQRIAQLEAELKRRDRR